MPSVSLIVSTYKRPDHLPCVLQSLKLQTFTDFEVIVTDNAERVEDWAFTVLTIERLRDRRFRCVWTRQLGCYHSAELGAQESTGEYLGFPSDDDYYLPQYLEALLAARPADLLYCDTLYSYEGCAKTWRMDQEPRLNHIDKGGFLLRRSFFGGFPGKSADRCPADGEMIEAAVRMGAVPAHIEQMLWVHN